MSRIVQKYGGSSIADIARLERVADLVCAQKSTGDQVVVVVSAMGSTTDTLVAMAQEISPAPPTRELDMLVTAGERISMALLSMAIQKRGHDAISFTGSQSGIITENTHQGAHIVDVRPFRLEESLQANKIVIVAGFQGVSRDKEVTTLGRGGSDTTAVALAAALHAQRCEIYSDVDGVYSTDPSACPTALHLPHLSYAEMKIISHSGAKVLHHNAVALAEQHGLVLFARKTGDESCQETRIDNASERNDKSAHTAVIALNQALFVRFKHTPTAQARRMIESLGCRIVDGDPLTLVLEVIDAPDNIRTQLERALLEKEEDINILSGCLLTLLLNENSAVLEAVDDVLGAENMIWKKHQHPVYRWGVPQDLGAEHLNNLHNRFVLT